MAVTVPHSPFVVLDEGDRIVGVGPGAESQFGPLVGSVMWDCFPGSEPLFKPYYDAARSSGEEAEFVQFYDGNVARIRAVPQTNGHLDLYWDLLVHLDALTLERLAQTLDESLEAMDAEHGSAHRSALRQSLRVIEGGVSCSSAAVEALRHAAPDAYLVLDDADRITHVSSRLHDDFGRWIGHVLWEHLPCAREVYGPTFDEARASGRPVESVVFYSGRVKRLTVIPGSDGLAVHVERLAEIDVTTLATLTKSLVQIAAELAGRACAQRDSPAHASLRALP